MSKKSTTTNTLEDLSETPITQADIVSGKLKLIKRNASHSSKHNQQTISLMETLYLLQSPANAAHLAQSICELKAGEATV